MRERYGPWAVVLGASDGTGAAFAEQLAAQGVDLVLVARRGALLEELAARLPVRTRTLAVDLSEPGAVDRVAEATADLEVGLLVYNAGGDDVNLPLVERDADELRGFVQRGCTSVLEACHRFGRPMVARGRGGVLLVTSGAAWAGGAGLSVYAPTKAFGLSLAESLWAEWRGHGVDVLGLLLGPTDTPSLHRSLARKGTTMDGLADPADVARDALAHLGDGPAWSYGMPDPTGPYPLDGMRPRDAVELMSAGAAAATA